MYNKAKDYYKHGSSLVFVGKGSKVKSWQVSGVRNKLQNTGPACHRKLLYRLHENDQWQDLLLFII